MQQIFAVEGENRYGMIPKRIGQHRISGILVDPDIEQRFAGRKNKGFGRIE